MTERVGQQFGQYRLSCFLGQGSFGEVYLGEHIYNHTLAAVKVLQARLTAEDLKEFITEASTTFRLQHPHIVRLLDFGIGPANTPFLVMAYAANGTLRKLHPKGTRLPLDTIIAYVRTIAAALQHAHNERLIHRDVKPENILLGPHDEVWLSDFGITSVVHSTRSLDTEKPGGTVPYMAPEQIQGKPRPASDQYALGIIVYEWLCGERPFNGTAIEIAMQHALTPPPPLRERVPMISADMEQVVLTALAKDPAARFASVQAFATALEQASQSAQLHSSILSQAPTTPDQPRQPALKASPMILLPQQTIVLPTSEVVQTPLVPPDQSRQPTSISNMQSRPEPAHKGISRRTVLLSLTGTAAVTLAGGGITWAILFRENHVSHPVSTSSPTVTSINPATTSQPTSQGILYVGSWFNHLTYALKMSDGTVLWHSQGGSHSDEAMVFANGVVYCGSDDHTVYALRASDGSLLWRYQTGGIINSPPSVSKGVVYIGSWDNFLYALKATDGSRLWRYQTSGDIHSSPAVVNGVVYFGSGDRNLYALHANDGSVVWRYQTGAAVYAWPTVVNGQVYVGSGDHTMYALQASDGSLLWQYLTGDVIWTTATVDKGVVYTCSGDHTMYALQADNGNLLRRYQIGQQGTAQPAVVNGVIYACSVDANVYALRASDGSQIWRYQTAGFMGAKPVLVNGVVYAGGSSGLYALRASDGTLLWKFEGAVTAPAVG